MDSFKQYEKSAFLTVGSDNCFHSTKTSVGLQKAQTLGCSQFNLEQGFLWKIVLLMRKSSLFLKRGLSAGVSRFKYNEKEIFFYCGYIAWWVSLISSRLSARANPRSSVMVNSAPSHITKQIKYRQLSTATNIRHRTIDRQSTPKDGEGKPIMTIVMYSIVSIASQMASHICPQLVVERSRPF
jgi:hypothetical protein